MVLPTPQDAGIAVITTTLSVAAVAAVLMNETVPGMVFGATLFIAVSRRGKPHGFQEPLASPTISAACAFIVDLPFELEDPAAGWPNRSTGMIALGFGPSCPASAIPFLTEAASILKVSSP